MTLSKEEIREIGKELKALLLPELVQELKTELIADLKSEIFADLVKDVKSQVLVEIKETYDKKNATIYKKIDSTKTSLSTKVNANETLVKDLATRVQSLEEKNLELEKDNSELHEMEKELGKSLLKINVLERRLEDRTNRSMRKTLVFKGIHEGEEEKTWQHTEDILAEVIANTLDVSTERASGMIERAHRSRPRSKTKGKGTFLPQYTTGKTLNLLKKVFRKHALMEKIVEYMWNKCMGLIHHGAVGKRCSKGGIL